MKTKQLLLRIGAALFLLALLLVLFRVLTPPVPVAYIRVVDESGRPVAGVLIAPDGLRPKKNGGHYLWDDNLARSGIKAVTVRTDADGYAAVRYPFYVVERLETAQISFAV